MRKFLTSAGLLLLLPFVLMAQDTTPKAKLFIGPSYLRMEKTNQVGWDASITGMINKNLGIVGDVSGYYNSQNQTINGVQSKVNGSIHSVLGGIRVSEPTGRFDPFAQALFGWARVHSNLALSNSQGVILAGDNSANAFAASLGGGIDFKVAQMFAIRMVDVEYMLIRSNGQKQQGTRVSGGVVFNLGKKKE